MEASFGDMRYGALMSLARATVLQLRRLPVAPRNWRPHILVLAGDLERRLDLVRFAAWLNQERGLLTVTYLAIGSTEELAGSLREKVAGMQRVLDAEKLTAFAEGVAVHDFEEGALAVAQAHGIAGVVSNTLMLGWSDKPERRASALRLMRTAALLGKSTLICRIAPRSWSMRPRRIDVWWGGLEHNGDMMLLLAHLLSLNADWRSARIAVKCVVSAANPSDWSESRLRSLLERSRIQAEPEVIADTGGLPVREVIQRSSAGADLVFMGLREPSPGEEVGYAERLAELVGGLPTVILVRAAGPFAGQLLEAVEEGRPLPGGHDEV
jgi:hypothetical protein